VGTPPVKRLRRLGLGLSTLTGRPRGFFVPYRHADALPPPGRPDAYPEIGAYLRAHEDGFRAVLGLAAAHAPALAAMRGPAPEPRIDQDWFPRLDAAAAYALVRDRRPSRIVEVGSGHSTRFLARAARDGGFACDVVAVDPAPRAPLPPSGVRHVAATAETADPALFAALGPGDALFVDSSHVAAPGTDVDMLFARVVPRLPAGVLIHVHDVFLPDDYPADWAWRGYAEQTVVAAMLAGGGFRPLFASHWAATRMAGAAAEAVGGLPLPAGARETSLWLEKTAPAIARF
jgi:hypothetical protein